MDEVRYAGGINGSNNTAYYLYTNSAYWTMSPYYWDGSYTYAQVFIVGSNGYLPGGNVISTWGVRPVINLSTSAKITSGNGTYQTPYVVE